jgi:hypothetical protein
VKKRGPFHTQDAEKKNLVHKFKMEAEKNNYGRAAMQGQARANHFPLHYGCADGWDSKFRAFSVRAVPRRMMVLWKLGIYLKNRLVSYWRTTALKSPAQAGAGA